MDPASPLLSGTSAISLPKAFTDAEIAQSLGLSEDKVAESVASLIYRELSAAEERFDLAVKGTNDGILDLDVITGKNCWTPRLHELLGHEDQEIGANLDAFQSHPHPDDRAYALKALRDHLQYRRRGEELR